MVVKENKTEANFKHIVRIVNVDLPGNKPIRVALLKIKGLGMNFADSVCQLAKVDRKTRTGYLSQEEVDRLNSVLERPQGFPVWMLNRRKDFDSGEDKHVLTGNLTFVHDNDLKRLKKIKTLRGLRHQAGLPVRGQRTRAHFRKHKGKVIGVTKKKEAPAAKKEAK